MKKISIDLDGVVCDFTAKAIPVIRKMFVPDLPADYYQSQWNFSDIVTAEQWSHVLEEMLHHHNLWHTIPPHQEAVDAIKEYVDAHGPDSVHFLTARVSAGATDPWVSTNYWLRMHGLPDTHTIVVLNAADKLYAVMDHGIQMHLDDRADTIELLFNVPGHQAILLDRPWNRLGDLTAHLPRVYSVAEFLMLAELS